ncbi:MAG: homoserine dehydrogenase [Acidimicrobiales bacterium]|jgi:homoserine dehydrogenase
MEAPQAGDTTGGEVRVGLLGYGNVGVAFTRLIDSQGEAIALRTGLELSVTRIAVRNPDKPRPGSAMSDAGERLCGDAARLVKDPAIDVIVELIGGVEPARSLVLAALDAGKPVVTANKELLAGFGAELLAAAEQGGVDLLFEASVAGAIPLIRLLNDSLAGERIVRVMGIVNGTTNFILTSMSEEGCDYETALAEAKALGYAEPDPTADVEGLDAQAKAAILAGIAFDADVVQSDVFVEGITAIGASDIAFVRKLGYEVKLLAVVERVGSDSAPAVAVRVHPAMVPREHPLASVRGPFNAVFVQGDTAGELMVYGRGAGGTATASAVLGDLVAAAHHLREETRGRPVRRERVKIQPISALCTQYYVTVDVKDQPGVLAAVARVFGEHNVSIQSMEQLDLGDGARLVLITHTAREADVQATLASLGGLDVVARVGALLRLIGRQR